MAKLNQSELDAVTWKIHAQLKEMYELAVDVEQAKARIEFEKESKLKKAYDTLKAHELKTGGRVKVDVSFIIKKTPKIPPHYEIKTRLIIKQISTPNLENAIRDLASDIADEIGL